jgi:hypothetical protein
VIGSVEMQLGALYLEQLLPKIDGESGVSIRDNRIRHAMKLEYIIYEYLSHCGGYERVLKSTKQDIWRDDLLPP